MSSLSAPLQAVVALFSGPLHGVRFADIDGETLGSLATDVEAMGGEVEALEAQLASLREALTQKQEALSTLAQQALAYARIYAEGDEALAAELDEIALPRAAKPRKGASAKSSSERGARSSKENADNGMEQGAAEAEPEAADPEPPVRSKTTRKSAPQPEPEEVEEVPAPAKAGRRKLPTRTGRAR